MNISDELQKFIEENIDLIEQNTKESWEQVYDKNPPQGLAELFITQLNIDPAEKLGCIPERYLKDSEIKEYVVPDNILEIAFQAFYNCKNLTSVTIPDSVTSIDLYAFAYCKSLTSITIPNSVKNIGVWAFSFCSNLTNVEIPKSVTNIGDGAFEFCTSLKEINYLGTKKEARQLGIGNKSKKRWRERSSIKKIICTDGVIEL